MAFVYIWIGTERTKTSLSNYEVHFVGAQPGLRNHRIKYHGKRENAFKWWCIEKKRISIVFKFLV